MMTLGKLHKLLALAHDHSTVVYGFDHAHSWRGIYAEASFRPALNVPVKDMRAEVEKAMSGEVFQGWKGGDFTYDKHTTAHLDDLGDSYDRDWSAVVMSIVDAIDEWAD